MSAEKRCVWWSKRNGLSCEECDGGGGLGDEGAAHVCDTYVLVVEGRVLVVVRKSIDDLI